MPGITLGIDIGGSKIRVTVQDDHARVTRATQVATPSNGGDSVIDAIAAAVERLDGRTAAVCGVGTAGDIDPANGRIAWATTTIRNWNGYPLGERLAARLTMPVLVENDGNAATYAEATFGAATGAESVLGVFVGTGIGGGIILGGKVLRGARRRAGEIGHTDATGAGEARCPCGARGHIEAVASATAVEGAYAARAAEGPVLFEEIARRAKAGESYAITVLELAGTRLAEWLPSMIAVLDPMIIVVGGGAVQSEAYWQAFMAGLGANPDAPPVRQSLLGAEAVAIGAAALARVHLAPSAH